MIYILDSDFEFGRTVAHCVAGETGDVVKVMVDSWDLTEGIDEDRPKLIFMEVLLDGPDSFTLLNELQSYPDTAKIPVVMMTALKVRLADVKQYGVKYVLNKETMTPEDIAKICQETLKKPKR